MMKSCGDQATQPSQLAVNSEVQNQCEKINAEDVLKHFGCNICYEIVQQPVVTFCGHLYCWSCLYHWLELKLGEASCPVCKADIDVHRIVPIYCGAFDEDCGLKSTLPSRPKPNEAKFDTAPRYRVVMQTNHINFPTGDNFEVFGAMNMGYQVQEGSEQHQAFLSRLLLMLGSFVIMCLLLF